MNLKEYIRHIKSICKQGILRHKNVILDETFQKELLEIIKCYEQLEQKNKELQQENEKNKHYKTLYQSLKKQKEELRDWLGEKIICYENQQNTNLGEYERKINFDIYNDVLGMMEELEGVSNED